jgi:hypothetical protein
VLASPKCNLIVAQKKGGGKKEGGHPAKGIWYIHALKVFNQVLLYLQKFLW